MNTRDSKNVGYLRLWQVIGDRKRGIPALIPVCRSSWWQGVSAGRFPKPVKLGARTTVWRVSDIEKLLEIGVEDPSPSSPEEPLQDDPQKEV